MKPAQQIAQAIGLLKMASYNMRQIGISEAAMAEIVAFANDLQAALDELPDAIMDGQTTHCRDCRYYHTEFDNLAQGDGMYPVLFHECVAYHYSECPMAAACGFDADDVPAFLKRQAE